MRHAVLSNHRALSLRAATLVAVLFATILGSGCPNAEEEAKKKQAKAQAFMEAEAKARAEEDVKTRKAALDDATGKCKGGDATGCIALGKLFTEGDGKDPKQALAAFDDACAKKSKEGCTLAAQSAKDPKSALERWRKGCDLDDAQACVAAVAAMDAFAKSGGAVDEAMQVALFDKACTLGIGATCTALGMLAKEKDPKKAVAHFERGCAAKEPTACAQIAELYKTGKIGKKKEADKKAAEYLKKACDLGLAEACAK
jgi:hypothetical protein